MYIYPHTRLVVIESDHDRITQTFGPPTLRVDTHTHTHDTYGWHTYTNTTFESTHSTYSSHTTLIPKLYLRYG